MEQSNPFSQIRARGCVDYMLRSTQQHHVQLSAMADQKAHILLGVAAIILTIIMSNLKEGRLPIWGMLLGGFILLSAVFALLAIMPSLKNKNWHRPNWLFFSSYSHMSVEEYMEKMAEVLADDGKVYETIVNEIYQMGQLLHHRKYRYLGCSYRLFLAGIVLGSCAWLIELWLP
jgi:hypothetical protein